MQGHGHPGRGETYAKALDAFARGTRFAKDNVERVTIAYEGKALAALFTRGDGEGPRPAVVYCNGLDSTKELLYFSQLAETGDYGQVWEGHKAGRDIGYCHLRTPTGV